MSHTHVLARSSNNSAAGVCAGIAEYFGWSTIAVRIDWVLVTVLTGVVPGVFMYMILWGLMPAPEQE